MAISFLAPGRDGPVRATGTPLRVGKADAVVEVRVIDRGRDDRLMAVALVTVRVIDPNWTSDGRDLGGR
jgi:acyl-coenzyme A thioesterase PaaI-like protein